GTARHGTARHGTARHGTARHGTARHGTARHGTARHGTWDCLHTYRGSPTQQKSKRTAARRVPPQRT
ncbi:hypothetical protein, partial [Paraburkholderia domus]|uniref:hypothetical protein n=1 Tax=Paraburkholderia domus TaxID=2793075 RepID=UPI0039A509B5